MATRKCGNVYFPKYFMAVRPFFTRIFLKNYSGWRVQNNSLNISSGAQPENLEPSLTVQEFKNIYIYLFLYAAYVYPFWVVSL